MTKEKPSKWKKKGLTPHKIPRTVPIITEIKNAEILLRAVKPTCHQKEGKKILFTREEKVSFGEGSTKGAEIISAAKYQIPKTQKPDKIKINGFETADLLFI